MESRRVLQCSKADRLLYLKWNIRWSISSPYAKALGQVVSSIYSTSAQRRAHTLWFYRAVQAWHWFLRFLLSGTSEHQQTAESCCIHLILI